MNVIGLGQAGCNIADILSAYPQYKTYKIDVGVEGTRCYDVWQYFSNVSEDYGANKGQV